MNQEITKEILVIKANLVISWLVQCPVLVVQVVKEVGILNQIRIEEKLEALVFGGMLVMVLNLMELR